MPDIGVMLRDARMRERIDITEVESATKIRAKYIRALENEEWDLLPGPTFVKTFLRTYGDYLGLDSRVLVEEYKQRFERPSPQELMPFGGGLGGRRQRRPPIVPPWAVVAGAVAVLVALLFVLGSLPGGEEDEGEQATAPTPTPAATERRERRDRRDRQAQRRTRRDRAAAARMVRLQIVPTGLVNVCLVSGGRTLIPSRNLAAGQVTDVFRGRRFRVTFGNGFARVRVNGRSFDVPDRDQPVGYEITAQRRRELSAATRPTCAP